LYKMIACHLFGFTGRLGLCGLFRHFSLARKPRGGMSASRLRGEKYEISCANGAELRDNNFNIGGHAIWNGIGQMDRKHQFEAEAIAAVSGPEYFALQRLLCVSTIQTPIR
jgi:hypothetical protein